jgi:Ca2+-binding EF-hand superfamily protein
MPKKTSSMLDS